MRLGGEVGHTRDHALANNLLDFIMESQGDN